LIFLVAFAKNNKGRFLPENMDKETQLPSRKEILLANLASQKRTVKVAAIVELSKIASEPEVLRRLQALALESDREIAHFASQAISRIQSLVGVVVQGPISRDKLSRQQFLMPLATEIPELLKFIREKPNDIPDELKPFAAEFLGKNGTERDVSIILSWLESCDSLIALSYIEAAENLSPKALVPLLPILLASQHPLVRVRAITALQKIDPEEAFAHLSELLGSRHAEERIAGISIAFVFPFEKVKSIILTLLSEEKDRDVLFGIETLLGANPEVDVALRLLDLIDVLPKNQAVAVSRIFKRVCEALAAVEIIPPAEAKTEAMVARWRKERLLKFLSDLEIQLTVGNLPKRDAIINWLEKNRNNPDVVKFLEKLAFNPATEDIPKKLGIVTQSPAKQQEKPPPSKTSLPEQSEPEEKRKLIENLDSASFQKYQELVKEEARKVSLPLRIAALNALSKFSSDPSDSKIAEHNLVCSDPGIVLAALRLLEKYDPALVKPFFPDLLKFEDPMIRYRVLRLAQKYDMEKAIETLAQMLRSTDTAVRAQATSCLFHCPFDAVFEVIVETLAKENHPDIARQLLTIVLSNPSSKVLKALDGLQNVGSPGVSILIAQARMDLFDLVLKYGMETFEPTPTEPIVLPPLSGGNQATKEQNTPSSQISPQSAGQLPQPSKCPAKPAKEEAPKLSAVKSSAGWPTKPYAISEVRNTIRKREVAQKAAIQAQETGRKNLYRLYLGGAFLAAFLFLLQFWNSSQTEHKSDGTSVKMPVEKTTLATNEIPTTFRMNAMCRLLGKVEAVNPDGTLEILSDDKKLHLKFIASYPQMKG